MMRARAESLLRARGWLSRQPEPFQRALLRNARLELFAKGQHVYHTGDEGGGIYGIVDGGFGVYVMTAHSASRMVHVGRTGMWFGTRPMLLGAVRAFTFAAVEDGSALNVPIAALKELAAEDPSTYQRLGALSEENMSLSIHALSDLLLPSSSRRIAAILLRISGATVADPITPPAEVQINQIEIGEMANASRDSVSRVIQQFKENGWIISHYNRIRITDAAGLLAFAYDEKREAH